jgi:hypothetical protein
MATVTLIIQIKLPSVNNLPVRTPQATASPKREREKEREKERERERCYACVFALASGIRVAMQSSTAASHPGLEAQAICQRRQCDQQYCLRLSEKI